MTKKIIRRSLAILFTISCSTMFTFASMAETSVAEITSPSYTEETEQEGYGPGFAPELTTDDTTPAEPEKEETTMTSLGMFKTSGYCNCEKCSSGCELTYSGTVPQEDHTISADITKLPIGTKVMIEDIIYTVEDVGSSVSGNKIDIYYDTHEEAWNHGIQEVEVFLVEEVTE